MGTIRQRWVIGTAGALSVLLGSARPTQAFYWTGITSGVETVERTLINPPDRDKPGNPPTTTLTSTPDPSTPFLPVGPPPPPESVPEPATGVVGLIGLGLLIARRWATNRRLK